MTEAFPSTRASFFADAPAFVATLTWLRPCVAAGQLAALLFAVNGLDIVLPWAPLAGGLVVLALASSLGFWRLQRPWSVGEVEAAGHVAFDILQLAWMLYFTGGAANPFITLLLIPVALCAATLSVRAIAVVTVLAMLLYGLLMLYSVPLPDMRMGGSGFRLHLAGMAVNFFVAVLLLAVFVGRLNASLRAQREETRELRERALRDEGILAIATQVAEAAHRLNTPLSTLRTLVPEILHEHPNDPPLRTDLELVDEQLVRCREILQGMVDYGRQQLDGSTRMAKLGDYVQRNVDRFRLLHPEADVRVCLEANLRGHPVALQAGLEHALLNLMQNALEASRQQGFSTLEIEARIENHTMIFVITDHGSGFEPPQGLSMSAASTKANGLGIGLALARATIERMHGELETLGDASGTQVHVRIPLADPP